MNIQLNNKHVLVTGGSKGIGNAIATQMARSGANVTIVARSAPEAVLSNVRTVIADFSKPDEAMKTLTDYVSENPVDILINNTGGPAPGPLTEATWDQFENALNMHLKMSHHLVKLVTPHMKEKQFGRIINIISTSVKMPIPGLGVSNTVRGAMANWSKTLSLELGPFGITVNNLLPGFIATTRLDAIISAKSKQQNMSIEEVSEQLKSWVPARRFGQPEEMANMAVFLASEFASYVNGTNIPIDGGRTTAL